MNAVTSRPRGRRPGRDDTKGAIAASALELFDRDGYDRTSLRAIARHADVDPALVHHYFESKGQLFTTVLLGRDIDVALPILDAASGDPGTVGVRLAKAMLRLGPDTWTSREGGDAHTSLARRRTKLLCEFWAREVFGRVAASFGHRNDVLRGQMAAVTVFALMRARQDGALGTLSAASARSLVEPVGRVLQDYLVADW